MTPLVLYVRTSITCVLYPLKVFRTEGSGDAKCWNTLRSVQKASDFVTLVLRNETPSKESALYIVLPGSLRSFGFSSIKLGDRCVVEISSLGLWSEGRKASTYLLSRHRIFTVASICIASALQCIIQPQQIPRRSTSALVLHLVQLLMRHDRSHFRPHVHVYIFTLFPEIWKKLLYRIDGRFGRMVLPNDNTSEGRTATVLWHTDGRNPGAAMWILNRCGVYPGRLWSRLAMGSRRRVAPAHDSFSAGKAGRDCILPAGWNVACSS